ncbi:protein RRP5-like protein, partial [Leptotrombidium deliense]
MLVEKLAKISRKEQLKRKRKDTEESINDSLVDEQSESSAPVSKKKKKSKTLENKIEESEDTSKIGTATKSCLPVAQGFEWDDNEENASDNEGSDSSDDENTKTSEKRKKSRKERNEEARKKEEYLRQREEILMDKQRAPETVDDFERKVMSSPNSSIVWIHYIAFHLEAGEIEKARSIAERALITISFREENEKFNIW